MDNFYKQCPPVMSDGRMFTDYRSDVRVNEYVKNLNKIYRDDEYRRFLQDNAEDILDKQWEYEKERNSCWVNECVHNYPTRVYPACQVKERKSANMKHNKNPGQKFECQKYKDYRATITKNKL